MVSRPPSREPGRNRPKAGAGVEGPGEGQPERSRAPRPAARPISLPAPIPMPTPIPIGSPRADTGSTMMGLPPDLRPQPLSPRTALPASPALGDRALQAWAASGVATRPRGVRSRKPLDEGFVDVLDGVGLLRRWRRRGVRPHPGARRKTCPRGWRGSRVMSSMPFSSTSRRRKAPAALAKVAVGSGPGKRVPHALQEPVGDAGGPRERRASRGTPSASASTDRIGRVRTMTHQVGLGVTQPVDDPSLSQRR